MARNMFSGMLVILSAVVPRAVGTSQAMTFALVVMVPCERRILSNVFEKNGVHEDAK